MNKRGELTSNQIIGIVLAIVGFVIVLMLIVVLDFSGEASDELCKTSVLTRATSPGAVKGYVPLKCKTDKICLTDGGGKCEEYFAGEDPTIIKLKGSDDEKAEMIAEVKVGEMYDCWRMMGGGKFSIFSDGAKEEFNFDPKEVTCVICSRVAVDIEDEESRKRIIGFERDIPGGGVEFVKGKLDINRYMLEHTVSGRSYVELFTGDSQFSSYVSVDENILNARGDVADASSIKFETDTNEMAIVFSQIDPDSYLDAGKKLRDLGIAGAGTTFLAGGFTAVNVATNPYALVVMGIAAVGITGYTIKNVYGGRVASEIYCGKFVSSSEKSKEGCSAVSILPYEVSSLNSICKQLEGSP